MAFYKEFKDRIVNLQHYWSDFKVDFLDRDGFKKLADRLDTEVGGWTEICITGYFSETIREEIEKIIRHDTPQRNVRLLCCDLPTTGKGKLRHARDRKNLEVLKKLKKAGAEVRVSNRLHARFLVAYHSEKISTEWRGLLVIGSFDFNTECIGKERYDAGIRTTHPDLIKSVAEFFDEIWNDAIPLLDKYE